MQRHSRSMRTVLEAEEVLGEEETVEAETTEE